MNKYRSHIHSAVKVMLLINPTNNLKAIELLTTLDATQNVQICSTIYEDMQAGDFGLIDKTIVEKYRSECNRLWPRANLFQTNPPPPYPPNEHETNGGTHSN